MDEACLPGPLFSFDYFISGSTSARLKRYGLKGAAHYFPPLCLVEIIIEILHLLANNIVRFFPGQFPLRCLLCHSFSGFHEIIHLFFYQVRANV